MARECKQLFPKQHKMKDLILKRNRYVRIDINILEETSDIPCIKHFNRRECQFLINNIIIIHIIVI
jgi:hypothetical protein